MGKASVSRSLPFLVLIWCCLVLVVACKEPVEGCLDVEATNYDVSADDACPDCCTYPQLVLQVSHRYDSLSFSFDSFYPRMDDTAQFQQVIFYLSDFRLVNLIDSLEVVETIDLDLKDGNVVTFKDDFTLVSRSVPSFSYIIGEIRGAGQFNTLRFNVGLAGEAANVNANRAPTGHELGVTEDTLWTFDQGYVFNRVEIIPDTNFMDVVRRIDVLDTVINISLPFSKEVERGFDVEIPLKVDYEMMFSGINFATESEEDIIQKIVINTANAFSISE